MKNLTTVLCILIIVYIANSCNKKEEHADDAPATERSVNTEISVVVIYPEDIQSWALGGVDNETYIKSALERTNKIWASQNVGGKIVLAGHKSIDFSNYASASSDGWKADLVLALMNHTVTSIHQELQNNLTSIMNEYSADCLIYWRKHRDGSNAVSGASAIGADKNRCMMQLTYYSFGNTVTFTHEFGHLQGCEHGHGYETPNPVTFTYVDNDTYTDYYRTLMHTTTTKSVADNTSISTLWKFSTESEKIQSSPDSVDCSRHVPQPSGGTLHTDYKCSFASEASLGDNSSYTCLNHIKSSITTHPHFR